MNHHPESHFSKISSVPSEKTEIVKSVLPPEFKTLDSPAKKKEYAVWCAAYERQYRRYHSPSLAHLTSMTKDPNKTEEIWQRVATKWSQGAFRKYDRELSFGNFLKKVLTREVYAMWRRQGRELRIGEPVESYFELADVLELTASQAFDNALKDQIIEDAYKNLEHVDHDHFVILKEMRLAASVGQRVKQKELAAKLGVSNESLRKRIQRARMEYSHQIVLEAAKEIGQSVVDGNLERIEVVIDDLGLRSYCHWDIVRLKFCQIVERARELRDWDREATRILKRMESRWANQSGKKLAEEISRLLVCNVTGEDVSKLKGLPQKTFELFLILEAARWGAKDAASSYGLETAIQSLVSLELLTLCEEAAEHARDGMDYFTK